METYTCLKCGHHQYTTDEISTTGTGLTKLFDIQNRQFTAISCQHCYYTELYKGSSDDVLNMLDLLI